MVINHLNPVPGLIIPPRVVFVVVVYSGCRKFLSTQYQGNTLFEIQGNQAPVKGRELVQLCFLGVMWLNPIYDRTTTNLEHMFQSRFCFLHARYGQGFLPPISNWHEGPAKAPSLNGLVPSLLVIHP